MAKLLDVKEPNKRKAFVEKGIIILLCFAALVAAALIHDSFKDEKANEFETEVQICVHVKGAVGESGLYYVPYGTRINDLDKFAGGFLEDADLDGVNLAEFVNDGDEVYIPFKGSAEKGGYNLNAVTAEELIENVEGIGETYARKIVEYREEHGGFNSVSELKLLLGENTYKKIRERFYIGE